MEVRELVTPCDLWTGSRDARGIPRAQGTTARRLAYVEAFGEIPENTTIITTCGRRDCVAPAHLRALSAAQAALERAPRLRAQERAEIVAARERGVTLTEIASLYNVTEAAIRNVLAVEHGDVGWITRRRAARKRYTNNCTRFRRKSRSASDPVSI